MLSHPVSGSNSTACQLHARTRLLCDSAESSCEPWARQRFCCCCSGAYEHTHISVLNSSGGLGNCLTNGSEFLWEFSRSPKNGCHFNCCTTKAVHNPKTSNDDFPNFRIIPLRNDAS